MIVVVSVYINLLEINVIHRLIIRNFSSCSRICLRCYNRQSFFVKQPIFNQAIFIDLKTIESKNGCNIDKNFRRSLILNEKIQVLDDLKFRVVIQRAIIWNAIAIEQASHTILVKEITFNRELQNTSNELLKRHHHDTQSNEVIIIPNRLAMLRDINRHHEIFSALRIDQRETIPHCSRGNIRNSDNLKSLCTSCCHKIDCFTTKIIQIFLTRILSNQFINVSNCLKH